MRDKSTSEPASSSSRYYRRVLLDINERRLCEMQDAICEEGGKAECRVCDIIDQQPVHRVVQSVMTKFHKIDIPVTFC